ncbi:MAG: o-succinylbenzoate--CoA ligase [Solirubrobacteraceae bacterium]
MRFEPWLLRAARQHPARVAVETPGGALNYAQLAERAVARASDFPPAERVPLRQPPGLAFAVELHACLLAGATAVPIDPRLPAAEQQRIAAGSGASASPRVPHAAPDTEAAAIEIQTSGTSGRSKPVTLSYGNLLWSALGSAVALGLDPQERWLCALPLSHVGGISILVRSAIYGTTAIVHERWETERVLVALRQSTLVSLVPTTLNRLLDAGLTAPRGLRCALVGGAPLPPALLRRARDAGVPVAQTYGLTEACSQVTTQSPSDPRAGAGPPLFCTRVTIGEEGEILVSGPTVAGGGLLATGDLGHLDEHGHLHVTGRKADTIVSGGENVAPAEVEAVLLEFGGIEQAAVVGRPDREWGERICALLVGSADLAQLRAHCAARLAPYQVPKDYAWVAELPRTTSGKLLRGELRELLG